MKWKLLNKSGKIPANTECPFKDDCNFEKSGSCDHKGLQHQAEFSCAVARALEFLTEKAIEEVASKSVIRRIIATQDLRD